MDKVILSICVGFVIGITIIPFLAIVLLRWIFNKLGEICEEIEEKMMDFFGQ